MKRAQSTQSKPDRNDTVLSDSDEWIREDSSDEEYKEIGDFDSFELEDSDEEDDGNAFIFDHYENLPNALFTLLCVLEALIALISVEIFSNIYLGDLQGCW
jgi:hypothetical protein